MGHHSAMGVTLLKAPVEKQTIPSTHPILSVLLFPEALAKLRLTVGDVKRFCEYLKSLETSGENGVMSKNVLLDTIDGSGVNLEALESLLAHISKQVEGSNGERLPCSSALLESSILRSN